MPTEGSTMVSEKQQKRAEDSPGLPAVPLSVKEGFTLSCSWLIGFLRLLFRVRVKGMVKKQPKCNKYTLKTVTLAYCTASSAGLNEKMLLAGAAV